MNSTLSKLLEGSVLNEDTKAELKEAWDNKLDEAREEISAELREEFALRYEKDKNSVFEAMESMVKDQLKEEFDELRKDKLKVKEKKIELDNKLEKLSESNSSIVKKLISEEIKEFRSERKQVSENLNKLQGFVQKQLKEELQDFSQDRNALIEARVNFEKTKKQKLDEAKQRYVETASKVSEKVIRESLKSELSQFRKDLKESKQNMFGKKLFEAFAQEFMATQYNESSELKKLSKIVESTKSKMKKLEEAVNYKDNMLNEAKKEASTQKELRERSEKMNGLLAPLNKNQRRVMQKLLESTPTKRLDENFSKYVDTVLKEDNNSADVEETKKNVLNETHKIEYDGNHKPLSESDEKYDQAIFRLKSLSGIN